jgi:hypothetical protein
MGSVSVTRSQGGGGLYLGEFSTSPGAGTSQNYTPGSSAWGLLVVDDTTGAVTLGGLQTGVDGRLIIVCHIGSNSTTLNQADAGSSSANRFLVGGSNLTLNNSHVGAMLMWVTNAGCWVRLG